MYKHCSLVGVIDELVVIYRQGMIVWRDKVSLKCSTICCAPSIDAVHNHRTAVILGAQQMARQGRQCRRWRVWKWLALTGFIVNGMIWIILVWFQVFQYINSVKFCHITKLNSSGLIGVQKWLTAIDANSSSHFIMSDWCLVALSFSSAYYWCVQLYSYLVDSGFPC